MSNIFATIMRTCYERHGASVWGDRVFPIHEMRYACVSAGLNTDEMVAVSKYISYSQELWSNYELELATRLLERNKKTLYCGVGAGRFLGFLQGRGLDIHGIDWQDDAIGVMELAQADGHIAAGTYQKMDSHAMTFADDSFGTVVLPLDIVEQSRDLDAMILEAKRVATDWVFIGSSHNPTNSETEPTDGECTIVWEGITEMLPYTSYPFPWMETKLADRGLTPVRLFQSEYQEVSGEEWFIEASV